jgi:hypothetical protein
VFAEVIDRANAPLTIHHFILVEIRLHLTPLSTGSTKRTGCPAQVHKASPVDLISTSQRGRAAIPQAQGLFPHLQPLRQACSWLLCFALVVEALCGSSAYQDGVDANGVTTLQVRRSIYLAGRRPSGICNIAEADGGRCKQTLAPSTHSLILKSGTWCPCFRDSMCGNEHRSGRRFGRMSPASAYGSGAAGLRNLAFGTWDEETDSCGLPRRRHACATAHVHVRLLGLG